MFKNYITKKIQFDLIIKLNRKMLSNSSPNILILVDNEIKFKEIKSYLKHILGSNAYTIYKISKQELTKPLWMKNCQLLLQIDDDLEDATQITILDYLKQGGKLLAIIETTNQMCLLDDIYQNKMNLIKKFILNDSVYVYNIDSGSHFITKVLPNLENQKIFEILLKDKIGLKYLNDIDSNNDTFQIFTQNKVFLF
jgi:hypothetical protein